MHLFRQRKSALAAAAILSVAAQAPLILSNYAIGRGLGDDSLGPGIYFFLASLGLVVNSIPLLPGGLGTGELGYAMLFRAFGSSAGAEIIAIWHVLFFACSLPGIVFYLKGKRMQENRAPDAC